MRLKLGLSQALLALWLLVTGTHSFQQQEDAQLLADKRHRLTGSVHFSSETESDPDALLVIRMFKSDASVNESEISPERIRENFDFTVDFDGEGSEVSLRIAADGKFTVDLSDGIYWLTVQSKAHLWPQFRVDVGSAATGPLL